MPIPNTLPPAAMYGLVNRAIEEMAVTRFGTPAWQEICRRAGLADTAFVGMNAYPDEVTYRLVGAASEVLGLSPEAVLEAFGEYWITYTAERGYGDLLAMAGATLPEFLGNLDAMHARVGLAYPALRPPSFRVSDLSPGTLRLHYHSERAGMAPLVVGLLRGLGKRLNTQVEATLERSRAQGDDHDEFLVRYAAA